MANGRANLTRCWGSVSRRSGSSGGEPIMKLPAGNTTSSGQLRHSLTCWPVFADLLLVCAWPDGGVAQPVSTARNITEKTPAQICVPVLRNSRMARLSPTKWPHLAYGTGRSETYFRQGISVGWPSLFWSQTSCWHRYSLTCTSGDHL